MKNSIFFLVLIAIAISSQAQNTFVLTDADPSYIVWGDNGFTPMPGDIIKVDVTRTKAIKILNMEGSAGNPIRIENQGGQVHIHADNYWGGLELKNCKHIVVSGSGDPNFRYGFIFEGSSAGVAFTEFSSDITLEFVEIGGIYTPDSNNGWSFFGLVAKKDFGGNLPGGSSDFPTFDNLQVHDCYIHDVHEGMYLGETKSPGMKMTNMKIYNNVVMNTYKEAIQVANTVTDFEIHNNYLYNSGLAGDFSHTNLLQIGDNSQGKVYNNALIQCPDYGIICLATGNIEIFNNYFEANLGIFADDREILSQPALMQIYGNYFNNCTTDENDKQVIKYYNQFMDLAVYDNWYNTQPEWGFLNVLNTVPDPVREENNSFISYIDPFLVNISEGYFSHDPICIDAYLSIGPYLPGGASPEIERIMLEKKNVVTQYGRTTDNTGLQLVDEQHKDPQIEEHPTGKFWNPKRQAKNEMQRYVIIDLHDNYFISDVYLYDLKKEGLITAYYLSGEEWIELFQDPLTQTHAWNHHEASVETQFIKLDVPVNFKGQINEIALYGYKTGGLKSERAKIVDHMHPEQEDKLILYPNPTSTFFQISNSGHPVYSQILDLKGKVVQESRSKTIYVDHLPSGLYFVRTHNLTTQNISTNRLVVN